MQSLALQMGISSTPFHRNSSGLEKGNLRGPLESAAYHLADLEKPPYLHGSEVSFSYM